MRNKMMGGTDSWECVLPKVKSLEVEKLSGLESIDSIYSSLTDKSHTAFLKTGKIISEHRWSIFGRDPFLVFESSGENITIYGVDTYRINGDPLSCFRKILNNYSTVNFPSSIPFPVGAIGTFSYDLKDRLEDIPSLCEDSMNCCDMHFSFFREFIITDEREKKFYRVRITTDPKNCLAVPVARQEQSKPRLPSGGQVCNYRSSRHREDNISGNTSAIGKLISNFTEEEYKEAVKKVREYIKKGTIYQANISQQFRVEFKGDSFRLFEILQRTNPAPMSAYLDCGNFKLISSSPERFLMRKGKYVESKPIKGTRPRSKEDTLEDLRLKQELIESEKDSAELAMIVDLVRNDLGRTAQPGTVRVSAPKIIEEYTNVFHSLAIITSRLKEGVSSFELIRSCFPGGSITGCPKVQAMKVIEEIEKSKRGFYCGSIGYIGFNGDFDFSIAIRTFIEKNNNLYFNLGSGIVYDSDPQEEYDETLHKGETMFAVLNNIYGNSSIRQVLPSKKSVPLSLKNS